jgi:hypothetical protein
MPGFKHRCRSVLQTPAHVLRQVLHFFGPQLRHSSVAPGYSSAVYVCWAVHRQNSQHASNDEPRWLHRPNVVRRTRAGVASRDSHRMRRSAPSAASALAGRQHDVLGVRLESKSPPYARRCPSHAGSANSLTSSSKTSSMLCRINCARTRSVTPAGKERTAQGLRRHYGEGRRQSGWTTQTSQHRDFLLERRPTVHTRITAQPRPHSPCVPWKYRLRGKFSSAVKLCITRTPAWQKHGLPSAALSLPLFQACSDGCCCCHVSRRTKQHT